MNLCEADLDFAEKIFAPKIEKMNQKWARTEFFECIEKFDD